jgi:hypothetical protein
VNHKILVLTAGAVALSAGLTGCSIARDTAHAKPAAPVSQDGGSYGTVIALRDAFKKAGATCTAWAEDPSQAMPKSAQSGECDDWSLGTYASQSDKQWFVSYVQNQSAQAGDSDPTGLLVGKNWIIYGRESKIAQMQPLFGGTEMDRPAS